MGSGLDRFNSLKHAMRKDLGREQYCFGYGMMPGQSRLLCTSLFKQTDNRSNTCDVSITVSLFLVLPAPIRWMIHTVCFLCRVSVGGLFGIRIPRQAVSDSCELNCLGFAAFLEKLTLEQHHFHSLIG